jgi:hypothetical protein
MMSNLISRKGAKTRKENKAFATFVFFLATSREIKKANRITER